MVIKNKILELMEEEEKERERKSKIKTIPLGKLEIGGIYKTVNGDYYIYLGERKVTFKVNGRFEEEKDGNCFARFYYDKEATDEEIIKCILHIYTYDWKHNIDVLKSNKKLVEMARKIDLQFPMKVESKNAFGSTFELTVE